MNCTRRDIENQFARVKKNGWLEWFQENAKKAGTTTAHLLGIGSRETNLKNIRGDFRGGEYHGFGVMQVDIGTDAEYVRTWTPDKVEPSVRRGTEIYLSKARDTRNCVGKRITIRNKSFSGQAVDDEDLRRIATAAYNCGRWAHYHFSKGNNVDSTTTGKDYSRDVYDRAIEFADILEKEGIEKNAVATELILQGKYARQADRDRFKSKKIVIAALPERFKLPVAESMEDEEVLSQADYERDSDLLGADDVSEALEEIPLAGAFESLSNTLRETGEKIETSVSKTMETTKETIDQGNKQIEKTTTDITNGFSPDTYTQYIPQITKAKKWLGGGFLLSLLSTFSAKAAGMPDWLIFIFGVITGIALAGLVWLFVTYYKQVFALVQTVVKTNADPTQHNFILTSDLGEFERSVIEMKEKTDPKKKIKSTIK